MERDLIIEIIQALKEKAYEQKQEYLQEKDEKEKLLSFMWLLGLTSALSTIKMKIMEFNPLDTDEEYEEIYKKYGIDVDIDTEFLNA